MNMQLRNPISQKDYATILAMSCGSILEWYEVFLYVYWAPVISKLFFESASESMNLLHSLFIFLVGFWARPIGGVFFGRLGDLMGRKYSLILSIVILIFPTLAMGLLPTYESRRS
jgi:MFS transporter, MHS family, proline/betaine transporter